MKPTTHKTVTRLAIELCLDRLSLEMQEMINQDSVVQGSADEDTKNLIQRATNWHFYRAIDSPIPKIYKRFGIKCKPTSKDILEQRIAEMLAEKDKKRFYNRLGRVLHHIQDMSTPSHVLPIYHGPIKKDYFEDFMEKNDCQITIKRLDPLAISNRGGDLVNIYEEAAKDCLKNVLKVDLPINERPYRMFWKHYTEHENSKIAGFGVYGSAHRYFKKLPKDNKYNMTKESLFNIQDTVTDHAIFNTCRALIYAVGRDKIE